MLKIYVSTVVIFCVASAQVQKAGENDVCAKFCDDIYLKEADGKQSSNACKQGCRYFSLEQMIPSLDYKLLNETGVREKCNNLCQKSYPNAAPNLAACQKGCSNQTMFTSGAMEVDVDGSDPAFKTVSDDIMQPAMNMMQKFEKMVENTKNFLNSDDGFFNRLSSLFNDDPNFSSFGQISPPVDFFDQLPGLGADLGNSDETAIDFPRLIGGAEDVAAKPPQPKSSSKSDSSDKSSAESHDQPPRKVLKNLENQFVGHTVGNSDEQGEPVIVVHMVPIDTDHDVDFINSISNNRAAVPDLSLIHNDEDSTLLKETAHEPSPPLEYISEDDWFACLSRRVRHLSMITRWMLCVALLLSIASMLWICLAIIRTAPRRRLRYLATIQKGGVDNVYYTTPPATASDKAPMIIRTCDFKAQPEAPPPYEPEQLMTGVKVDDGQKVNEEKQQA